MSKATITCTTKDKCEICGKPATTLVVDIKVIMHKVLVPKEKDKEAVKTSTMSLMCSECAKK